MIFKEKNIFWKSFLKKISIVDLTQSSIIEKMGFEANGGFGTEQIYIKRKRNAGGKAEQWI